MAPVTRSGSAHSCTTSDATTASSSSARTSSRKHGGDGRPFLPPTFRIDLSAPPRDRHREICRRYKRKLQALIPLYDEVLSYMPHPRLFKTLAKLALRRVASSEETEEILGIVEETGIPRHLVVAFNTFLDILCGCVSGGVRISDAGPDNRTEGVVHFRGLDWEMEQLRPLTICVEYVRDDEVVARAVTYAGYTGVLTGVRQGLSMSLNYRMRMLSPSSTLSHRFHQLTLLLGLRPSISSQLRKLLLSPGKPLRPRELLATIPKLRSSPCYLLFCTPSTVLLFEKNLRGAAVQVGDGVGLGKGVEKGGDYLIAATNHDVYMEGWSKAQWKEAIHSHGEAIEGISHTILEDSIERKQALIEMWRRKMTRRRSPGRKERHSPVHALPRVRDVRHWLQRKPVLNECTHFSCIMDPSVEGGGLLWVQAFSEPVDMRGP